LCRDTLDRLPELDLGLEKPTTFAAVLAGLARKALVGIYGQRPTVYVALPFALSQSPLAIVVHAVSPRRDCFAVGWFTQRPCVEGRGRGELE
jgi:hypothetical protein